MEKNYKFSLLMPINNNTKPNELKEALDSIFNQTIIPNEIVIVTDGFVNKDIKNILNNYNLNIYYLKKVQGISYALNYGIKKCKYNLIARMDSDDICTNNRFELQLNEFKKDNKLEIVGGQILEFDKNKYKKIRKVPLNQFEISNFSKKRNPFNHMSIMYKKKVVQKYGYKNIPFFEDYYLWMEMINNNVKVKNINEIIIYARSDDNHIKRRGGIKYIKYIYEFEKLLYKNKYINIFRFIINLSVRIFFSILPNKIRIFFYNIFLRK